jgi:hypothetical protein
MYLDWTACMEWDDCMHAWTGIKCMEIMGWEYMCMEWDCMHGLGLHAHCSNGITCVTSYSICIVTHAVLSASNSAQAAGLHLDASRMLSSSGNLPHPPTGGSGPSSC